MADVKPLKLEFDSDGAPSGIAEFQLGDTIEGTIVDISLSEVTDVSSTLNPATGDNLVWNGSTWTASADAGGGATPALSGLTDVSSAINPSTGDNLFWNGSLWTASADAVGSTPALSGLTDVSSTINPSTGDNLVWDGSKWTASAESLPAVVVATEPSSIDYIYGDDGGVFTKIVPSSLNSFFWFRSTVDGIAENEQYFGSGTGDLTINESGFPNASSTVYTDGYVEIPYDGIYLVYAKIGLNVTVSPTTISLIVITTTGWGGAESTLAMGTQVLRANIDPHQGVVDYLGPFNAGDKVAIKVVASGSNTVKPERFASVRFQKIG